MACVVFAFLNDMLSCSEWLAASAALLLRRDESSVIFAQVGMARAALYESAECSPVGCAESLSGSEGGVICDKFSIKPIPFRCGRGSPAPIRKE